VIDGKREVYKRHPTCECVVVIRQDRYETQVDLRLPEGWMRETLNSRDDELALPAFGLRCALKDLYRGTILLGDA
jgi:hypothetical protein